MGNIIYLNSPIIEEGELQQGLEVVRNLPQEDAVKIMGSIIKMLLLEVTIGLGLKDAEEINKEFDTNFDDEDDTDFVFFHKVEDLFNTAYRGCYFCEKKIDPNERFFNDGTEICPICQLKLANILTYEGVDPTKKEYLPLVFRKRNQEKRKE